jgi:hypothetical protein
MIPKRLTLAPAIGLPVTASVTTPLMAAVPASALCGAGGADGPVRPEREAVGSRATAERRPARKLRRISRLPGDLPNETTPVARRPAALRPA